MQDCQKFVAAREDAFLVKEAERVTAKVLETLKGMLLSLGLFEEALQCREELISLNVISYTAMMKTLLNACAESLEEVLDLYDAAQ